MITLPNATLSELKALVIELLINKTDKVSDVSDDSVLNGVAYGVAKIGQKALKEIAIKEYRVSPDSAVGDRLDAAAALSGVSPRRGALGSSTYLRIVANEGTQYIAGTNNFINQNGIVFELEETLVMGVLGFGYAKVRSIDSGAKTNISPNSIVAVTPQPIGHLGATNEYYAIGGIDAEDDEIFRQRIKNNLNILSIGTLEYLTQVFQSIDERVLRVLNLGNNDSGKRVLSIVTQNGVGFTTQELADLLDLSTPYFPISDINRFGNVIGVELQNVDWYYVGGNDGVDFRIDISPNYDVDEVRQNIQIGMTKYLDFRFWTTSKRVEWDNLLEVAKGVDGVKYVPDTYFKPRVDEIVPINRLPRIKNFIMRDLNGNIIFDSNGVLTPIFYTT